MSSARGYALGRRHDQRGVQVAGGRFASYGYSSEQIEETEAFERTLATDLSGKMAVVHAATRGIKVITLSTFRRFGMEKVNGG